MKKWKKGSVWFGGDIGNNRKQRKEASSMAKRTGIL